MIKILKGDCRELLKQIDSESIDCVITSPPYDEIRNYNQTLVWNFDVFKDIANELFRVIKKGGVVVWVVGDATIDGDETEQVLDKPYILKKLALNYTTQ